MGYARSMPAGREIELKLELSEADLHRLQADPRIRELAIGRAVTRSLRSVYFDTRDLDLARRRIGLRLRRVGGAQIQTVKTRGTATAGLFDRGEYEAPVAGDRPDLDAIPDAAVRAQLQRELAGRTLEPIFETEMRRTRRLMREDGDEWTLDADIGEVRAGDRTEPICEIELELRSGDPSRLYALALELHDRYDVRPGVVTKAERGYALVTGARPQPRRAETIQLSADDSLEVAIARIVEGCLEQILANAEPAAGGVDPEGVHQMRVGVRRLRSALSAFKRVLPLAQVRALSTNLRWLGAELGAARDLDVFIEEILDPLLRSRPDDPALKRLRDAAYEQRLASQDAVRGAIESRRFSRLVLEIGHWVSRAAWREQPLSEAAAQLFQPAEVFAHRLLAKRHRKARRLGRGIANAPLATKHELRILLKKLRYSTEFFRTLYPKEPSDRYIRRLSKLQNVLGHLNDVATAERLLDRLLDQLADDVRAEHHRAAGFVSGWCAQIAHRADRRLARQWKAFEGTRRFWKQ
jgi:triphosphatase